MKTIPLIPLLQFVHQLDTMSTTDFCKQYDAPVPSTVADLSAYQQIDCIKYNIIAEYAKLLRKPIREEMFQGRGPLLPGFVLLIPKNKESESAPLSYYQWSKDEFLIRRRNVIKSNLNKGNPVTLTSYHIKTIEDLTSMELSYNIDSQFAKNILV